MNEDEFFRRLVRVLVMSTLVVSWATALYVVLEAAP